MATFPEPLLALARSVLDAAREKKLRIVTAESCTGGLIAGCLTAIPGSSDVVERGFVTYSDESKTELLGVPADLIARHGAVSLEVARAMADGALAHSRAQLSISCTGIAGPGGRTATKAIGHVCFGYVSRAGETSRADVGASAVAHDFGDLGRDEVRLKSVEMALTLLQGML
jgi:nicotinamide-nucleotide amidase